MAVGLVDAAAAAGDDRQYGGRITAFVTLSCVTAALGGAIFGYDLGTSGTMPCSMAMSQNLVSSSPVE